MKIFLAPSVEIPDEDVIGEPGNALASELWLRVTSDEELERMPPPEHGPKLKQLFGK